MKIYDPYSLIISIGDHWILTWLESLWRL